jgi:hypothetical protein
MSNFCDISTTINYNFKKINPRDWVKYLKECYDNELMSTKEIIKEIKEIGLGAILKKKSKKQKKTVLPVEDANEHHREIMTNNDKNKIEFMSVEHETHDRWIWTKLKTKIYYRECLKQEKEKNKILTKEIKELKELINKLMSE